jgi:hypothetical protein
MPQLQHGTRVLPRRLNRLIGPSRLILSGVGAHPKEKCTPHGANQQSRGAVEPMPSPQRSKRDSRNVNQRSPPPDRSLLFSNADIAASTGPPLRADGRGCTDGMGKCHQCETSDAINDRKKNPGAFHYRIFMEERAVAVPMAIRCIHQVYSAQPLERMQRSAGGGKKLQFYGELSTQRPLVARRPGRAPPRADD